MSLLQQSMLIAHLLLLKAHLRQQQLQLHHRHIYQCTVQILLDHLLASPQVPLFHHCRHHHYYHHCHLHCWVLRKKALYQQLLHHLLKRRFTSCHLNMWNQVLQVSSQISRTQVPLQLLTFQAFPELFQEMKLRIALLIIYQDQLLLRPCHLALLQVYYQWKMRVLWEAHLWCHYFLAHHYPTFIPHQEHHLQWVNI